MTKLELEVFFRVNYNYSCCPPPLHLPIIFQCNLPAKLFLFEHLPQQFFFNDLASDFPLYTEAVKFFNHKDSMVRTAVRNLTLNVYKGTYLVFLSLWLVRHRSIPKFLIYIVMRVGSYHSFPSGEWNHAKVYFR